MNKKLDERSARKLGQAHPDLRKLFKKVHQIYPCKILETHRNKTRQNQLFEKELTKVQFPDSKHNDYPSEAVDASPIPIDWKDKDRFYYFSGHVMGVAAEMGIKIRHGGDWDSDKDLKDQDFNDLVHFELIT